MTWVDEHMRKYSSWSLNRGMTDVMVKFARALVEEAARRCEEPTASKNARTARAIVAARIRAMLTDDSPAPSAGPTASGKE